MVLKEIGYEDVNWIHLALDRNQWWALVKTVKKTSGSVKDGAFLTSFSRRSVPWSQSLKVEIQ
jgi:hypothetical protein